MGTSTNSKKATQLPLMLPVSNNGTPDVRYIRKEIFHGASREKFGELLGVPPSNLRAWENGTEPNDAAKTLLWIAQAHPEVIYEMSEMRKHAHPVAA